MLLNFQKLRMRIQRMLKLLDRSGFFYTGMKKLMFLWRLIHPDFLVVATDKMEKALIKALRSIVVPNGSNCGNTQMNLMCLPTFCKGLGIQLPRHSKIYVYGVLVINSPSTK
mmetsp:Transcript_23435/g.22576  ORF Transcript_23435/g.22576 Transcript_23435/m.22576 type:complete len:112 (-) Transcript_23435:650-985(-)